ncbi:MAG: DNA-directed RNA polymerase [Candidatus Woesearchaeota archaeon]
MFYKLEVNDYIRVPPKKFDLDFQKAVLESVRLKYENFIDPNVGIAVCVPRLKTIGEGIIIPGDGASYYNTTFELIVFRPELQEVVLGKIRDIADFGAFIGLGPIDGMIHLSQTMDDFVSFSKDKVLSGRDTKRSLRVNDLCRARIIAVSFKDLYNPKIGLTMRQPYLGRLDWVAEEVSKEEAGLAVSEVEQKTAQKTKEKEKTKGREKKK